MTAIKIIQLKFRFTALQAEGHTGHFRPFIQGSKNTQKSNRSQTQWSILLVCSELIRPAIPDFFSSESCYDIAMVKNFYGRFQAIQNIN